MHLAGVSEPGTYEGPAPHEATPDLDVRLCDEVDVVAATHVVELDPPQHARVDGIGKDDLSPMRSRRLMGCRNYAHEHARAHLCAHAHVRGRAGGRDARAL